jgi:hypothetical protein
MAILVQILIYSFYYVRTCSQRLYLLKNNSESMQDLPPNKMYIVFQAMIISLIIYAIYRSA